MTTWKLEDLIAAFESDTRNWSVQNRPIFKFTIYTIKLGLPYHFILKRAIPVLPLSQREQHEN